MHPDSWTAIPGDQPTSQRSPCRLLRAPALNTALRAANGGRRRSGQRTRLATKRPQSTARHRPSLLQATPMSKAVFISPLAPAHHSQSIQRRTRGLSSPSRRRGAVAAALHRQTSPHANAVRCAVPCRRTLSARLLLRSSNGRWGHWIAAHFWGGLAGWGVLAGCCLVWRALYPPGGGRGGGGSECLFFFPTFLRKAPGAVIRLLRSFFFPHVNCMCCLLCCRLANQHQTRDSSHVPIRGRGGGANEVECRLDPQCFGRHDPPH